MWRQDFLKKHHHHHGSKNPRIARENFGQLLKNGNVNCVISIVRVNLLAFPFFAPEAYNHGVPVSPLMGFLQYFLTVQCTASTIHVQALNIQANRGPSCLTSVAFLRELVFPTW